MLRRVALVRTDFSEEQRTHARSVCRLLVTANVLVTLRSSETSVLTRDTWRNTPEDSILHSHRRENFKILHKSNAIPVPGRGVPISCEERTTSTYKKVKLSL
jgi:hypothetical protein